MIKTRSLFVSFISKKDFESSSKFKMHHTKLQVTMLTSVFYCYCRLYVYTLSAPLIFKAIAFVRWVVTHSLTDSNFHGHCPNVLIQQHFLWFLIMSVESGTFKTLLSVHPASPILLTKRGPHWKKCIQKKIRKNVFIQFIPPFTPI